MNTLLSFTELKRYVPTSNGNGRTIFYMNQLSRHLNFTINGTLAIPSNVRQKFFQNSSLFMGVRRDIVGWGIEDVWFRSFRDIILSLKSIKHLCHDFEVLHFRHVTTWELYSPLVVHSSAVAYLWDIIFRKTCCTSPFWFACQTFCLIKLASYIDSFNYVL